MEKLILELTHQGKSSCHKLTTFPVTIGRAYDCDVVIPEITVSPKHLKIDKSSQGFELCCIGGENGTVLNKQKMPEGESMQLSLPSTLSMGNLRARLIDPEIQVAPTQLTESGAGWFSFLSKPFWAILLIVLMVVTTVASKYIRTPVHQEQLMYINALLLPLLGLFVVAFVIAVVSRLTMHRWAFIPALSISALLFLIPLILEHFGHFLSYWTTSGFAASILKYMANFLLLPVLLTLYLVRVHYTHWLSAIGVAVLVSTPVSAFFASDLVSEMSNNSGFSPMPSYNKALSAFDIRIQKTVEVDLFLQQTETILEEQVAELLSKESD